MEQRRYKVRLNSTEKLEELLQEIYDQACRQINEVQNEINKLASSTNLGSEDFTMEDKAKYSKAIHDFLGDKNKAISSKIEIAKFLGEVIKYNGNAKDAVNDKNFQKRTSLNLDEIRAAIKDDGGDTNTYNIKNN